MWGRASEGEKARYYQASRHGVRRIDFDADTRLTPEERGQMLSQLEQMACARSAPPPAPKSVQRTVYAGPRKLSVLELARTRKRITETVPTIRAAARREHRPEEDSRRLLDATESHATQLAVRTTRDVQRCMRKRGSLRRIIEISKNRACRPMG